jgi:hypothetical protein
MLIPSSFPGDEVKTIADGIGDVAKQYSEDVRGAVIYIQRTPTR